MGGILTLEEENQFLRIGQLITLKVISKHYERVKERDKEICRLLLEAKENLEKWNKNNSYYRGHAISAIKQLNDALKLLQGDE